MTPDVINRLRKIAGLLASSHEGEQLAAVGRANALLARHKLTWAEVIGGAAAVPTPVRRAKPQTIEIDLGEIPRADMYDEQLRAYAIAFLAEHSSGAIDIGGTTFLRNVAYAADWSPRQRKGFVRSLRRAWVLHCKAEAAR